MVNLVVDHSVDELNQVYRALGSGPRRDVVTQLASGPRAIADLRSDFDFTKQAMTKHVARLETAGIVTRSVIGRRHVLTLEPEILDEATGWLVRVRSGWDVTFAALEDHLR